MNQYSVDFKLKIVKMILKEHISKKSIMREYNVATKTQRQETKDPFLVRVFCIETYRNLKLTYQML